MQQYTLFQAPAPTQTIDIPAFGGKLDVSWNQESQVTQWGGLTYLFKIRRTKTVLSLFRQHENSREWTGVGEGWEALEAEIQLGGCRGM